MATRFKKSLCHLFVILACCGTAPSVLAQTTAPSQEAEELPLAELQRFTTVVEQIRNFYVKPAEDKTLLTNAIRGMLTGLDPHSAYLDEEDFEDLQASTSGKFGGLGIEVTMEDGFIRVVSPIDDTPAQKAGVLAGDIIVKIDDTPVKGLTLRKAVDSMRGEKGTPIDLVIIRKGMTKPLKINVVRDIIRVQSVKTKLFDEQYGYVRLSQFQAKTGKELIKEINLLKKKVDDRKLSGLILDLRNNPGGVLDASVTVADAFLNRSQLENDGLIVYTEGRLPGSQIKEYATSGDMLDGAPIVVLINGGSASASEIVAGALQDHQRAIIIGTQSFGKGSVQTVLPLSEEVALKLTTALYYTPAGRSIQATGIVPDIDVAAMTFPESEEDEEETTWGMIKESDLKGHLQSALTADTEEEAKAAQSTEEKELLKKDYQLHEALNVLKGLNIVYQQQQKARS